jgi:hypothetical protein
MGFTNYSFFSIHKENIEAEKIWSWEKKTE